MKTPYQRLALLISVTYLILTPLFIWWWADTPVAALLVGAIYLSISYFSYLNYKND